MPARCALLLFLCVLSLDGATVLAEAEPEAKKVVLIAGKKSHGPVGNGIHDYPWSVKLLKVMLDNSNLAGQLRVEYHLDGWPEDPRTLDDADTIMVVSDGRDGDKYEEAPHFQSEEHLQQIQMQIDRGCGFLTFHFSTFAPDVYADRILNWSGGYFDWETDGKREWYSAIQTQEADVELAAPDHPIARGLEPFRMKEEFYFNIRFRPDDPALVPIWTVPSLPGREPDGRVVAWARERKDGGRGFGTTCGHFYENWKHENFRRMILNAIVWTAQGEVPAGGVMSRYYTHEEITAALAGVEGTGRAALDEKAIRALILTGGNHPAHHWQRTTDALRDVLKEDPRMQVDVSEKIEDLAAERIHEYDLLVLNYCNWKEPGLSEAAKAGFVKYLEDGGGLCLIHFANGAFHFSLPEAGDSDWPEYRRICRRVWDHTAGKSGHDAYGKFVVEIETQDHPITAGLVAFETTDELYFRQQGDEPIEVLAKARSQVTGQFEPMAFVYDYGKGKVFQTVLGHGPESIRNEGTAELIRRGSAWVAGRMPVTKGLQRDGPAKASPEGVPLVDGRFGKALDARSRALFVEEKAEYRLPPITVECWAKLDDNGPFNILVANELKTSATHWEMFTFAGTGHFTVYMPGMQPDHVRTGIDICDGKWHYLSMVYEPERVRLYVDGRQAADQPIRFRGGETVPGKLAFGQLVSRELGCAGLIDEVRISKGARDIGGVPDAPFKRDEQTLGLWHFDEVDGSGSIADESLLNNPARPAGAAVPISQAQPPKNREHWSEAAVGFRWEEEDGSDNRWNQTDVGPFLASIVPLPNQPAVQKGLSIRVGDAQEATVCFDTEHLVWRAAWTGGFLRFNPARYGLISAPQIAGDLLFSSRGSPGWTVPAQYDGLHLHGDRVLLTYRVGETRVRESPWTEQSGNQLAVTRTIEIGPSSEPFVVPLLSLDATAPARVQADGIVTIGREERVTAVALAAGSAASSLEVRDGQIVAAVARGDDVRRLKVLFWSGARNAHREFADLVRVSPAPADLQPFAEAGPARWTIPVTTQGTVGASEGPYVLDTLTLPFENPWRALFFVSGHDFFPNGDIALSTVHGDVWRVSGVDETLGRLEWKRFATGLFQPLGLKIVDDRVHVLGRDQITRLHDRNGDGEADFYECFSNRHLTSAGGHDYVTCLETDSAGNFYFVHAKDGLIRVSADGKRQEIVATGFRNPNGMGLGRAMRRPARGLAADIITVSPQEGEWTPASCIIEVWEGGHYGYGGPRVAPERPLGYDPPLCWIPRLQDNSSGGQVWVDSDRWGPLSGQMLHLSYGRCRMMLALREEVGGTVQGGVVDFPLDFDSGVARGRFSPRDGQLYVSGLKGWVSAAVRDGCLQRVRYTGQPVDFPIAVRTLQNGLAITFSGPLDRDSSEQPDNYHVQQWNYRYAQTYGSPEFRVSDPRQEGRDDVEVVSATLLEDGRTVFLEIADLRPVMQMSIACSLQTQEGDALRQTLAYTIHRIGSERMDPSLLTRRHRPGRLASEEEALLKPGMLLRFEQPDRTDARSSRLAALHVEEGAAAATLLESGQFTARLEGHVRVPLKGEYEFQLDGNGTALLQINGESILQGNGDLAQVPASRVHLHQGYNRLEIAYQSGSSGSGRLRLLWRSDEFPLEPVPPTALFHNGSDPELTAGDELRRGRELFLAHQCARCHALPSENGAAGLALLERERSAPDLRQAGERLNPDWIFHWLLDPERVRDHATMPRLLDPSQERDRRHAADLAVWLTNSAPREQLPDDADAGLVPQGETLWADLGCIACHRLSGPAEEDDHRRLSLASAPAKYRPGMLRSFLLDPHARHHGSRMPDFQLSPAEADALAAFLDSAAQGKLPEAVELRTADAARGRTLFDKLGCAACHVADEQPALSGPRQRPVFGVSNKRGCLAESDEHRGLASSFAIGESGRKALLRFLAKAQETLLHESPAEASARLVRILNCQACHARDGESSPRSPLIVEETETGLLPETLPSLTWAGEKLHAEWTERLLSGRLEDRMRPWLKARMPTFPHYAHRLALGLGAEHGLDAQLEPSFSPDPQLAEIGDELTRKDTGLDCRQCHGIGSQQPLGDDQTQLALGINFSHSRERLRSDYYRRFVLDPPRYEIGSRMPKLAPDGRMTKVTRIYEGNANRQFEALWHFIQSCR